MTTVSHTWQEIHSQPQVWRATLDAFGADRAALQDFLAGADFDQMLVVGCGSTHYLAQTAAAVLNACARVPARALPASELWLFSRAIPTDRAFLLAISRSGSTTETLRAVERFRWIGDGPVLAVTCYPSSPLARQADFALVAPAAQERSIAQTRSFSTMLLLVQALAATLAGDEGMLERLHRLPGALEELVDRLADLPRRLGVDLEIERFFFLGSGSLYGLACEAMLKLKEMSLSYAEPYHFLEFRHGPMSMVDARTLVVGLLSDTGLAEEIRVLEDMKALGGRILALAEDASALSGWQADHLVELGSGLDEWLRSPLYLPILQRLAYHRAVAKGLDPDRPTNLTAVVEL
ncbi:MAG: SIS domain-containing protein [Anaerolineae bacterium]|nr:MAG: SIS domain-containing protein [Anaerolineae bacterium]